MRKHFLKLFIFIIMLLLFVPVTVKANEGDLRYEITDVNISGTKITFKGWAFIHRTNNFVNVKNANGDIIKSDGGQKVLMRAVDKDTKEVLEYHVWDAIDNLNLNEEESKYNFYCELATGGCQKSVYNTVDKNLCINNEKGVDAKVSDGREDAYCYYEDLYFRITFDFSGYDSKTVEFQIAATNNDFINNKTMNKIYYNEYGGYYTQFEEIFVSKNVVLNGNEYIDIIEGTVSNSVNFIASEGLLRNINDGSLTWTYGAWNDGDNGGIMCTNEYVIGNRRSASVCGDVRNNVDDDDNFLESGECVGTGYYEIKVKSVVDKYFPMDLKDPRELKFNCPYEEGSIVKWVYAAGSHVKVTGKNSFAINIKNKNLCDVTTPSSGPLECNESKTFNSKCDKLTVVTSEGNADVTIEQTGHISSVLTPTSTYAGGGFNFNIIYYNTIKWNYAPGVSVPSYHDLVVEQMNNKLKDYNSYISSINIANLNFGGKSANIQMVKKCSTNKNSEDYYINELVTTCVFSLPLAELALNGNVTYNYDVNSFGINNKYYTPIDYDGNYEITASISGMDRIKDTAAKVDSKVKDTKWTGDWNDNFTNCNIDLYTLISGIPRYIYRPIDINNPFPNRNAGINWYDWWNVQANKDRLKETYNNLDYTVILDNKTISDIKKYNEEHNYLEWDSIDEKTKESSFIKENSSFISKVGDD